MGTSSAVTARDRLAELLGGVEGRYTGTGTQRYRSSESALSLVASYADCRHEIQRVRSGYRVVLTFNLLLRGEPSAIERSSLPRPTSCSPREQEARRQDEADLAWLTASRIAT